MEIVHTINKLENLLPNNNSKSCNIRKHEVINTGDRVNIILF